MHFLKHHQWLKYLFAILSGIIYCICGPLVGITMGPCLLYHYFINNFKNNKIFCHPYSFLSNISRNYLYYTKLVKNNSDCFIINMLIYGGIIQPIILLYIIILFNNYNLTYFNQFKYWYVYHTLRIGPYSQHFAYFHTIFHKEGHLKKIKGILYICSILKNIFPI